MRQSRISSGQSTVRLGDARISSAEAWLTAVAFWLSGFALAGACAWHAQHPVRSSSLAHRTVISAEAPTNRGVDVDETLDDRTAAPATGSAETVGSVDSPGVTIMPQDVIVARHVGDALMQKP